MTIVRQPGFGFGHGVKLGDSIQLVSHVLTGPNNDLGLIQSGEKMGLILDNKEVTVQLKTVPALQQAGTTGFSDAAVWISDSAFTETPAISCSFSLTKHPYLHGDRNCQKEQENSLTIRGSSETSFYKFSGLAQNFATGNSGSPGRIQTTEGTFFGFACWLGQIHPAPSHGTQPHGKVIEVKSESSELLRYLYSRLCVKECRIPPVMLGWLAHLVGIINFSFFCWFLPFSVGVWVIRSNPIVSKGMVHIHVFMVNLYVVS